jgi:hypothetical protein
MKALEIYREATKRGLRIQPAGDKLAVFPKGHCPADFAEVLREHKAELLQWLTSPPCPGWQAVPPTDLPLNRLRPCPARSAARSVMAYIVRQIGSEPCLLCEWCLKRETAYWDTFHWLDEVCAYAAARDAACWQLNRDEQGLCEVLAGMTEVAAATKDALL